MILDKMQLLLGVSFSPPVHAGDDDWERYYLSSVKPFLSVAYRYPDIPLTLFFNGSLLEWMESQHPEYLTALSEMIKRKQVEVLGGAYYSPLLPLIPPTDRLGQIEALTTSVRKLLGRRPRGLWLTKGVWDPALVVHLTGSGMEYTFLEEADFRRVGLSSSQVGLPRLTEQQGRLLTIFPFHQDLSLRVQEGDFAAFEAVIPTRRRKDRSLLSLFLNVDSVAEGTIFTRQESNFEDFLKLVRSFYPEIEAVTPAVFLKKSTQSLERSYFSATTYDELCRRIGQPSKPSSASQTWKQFLNSDEAANHLYNKMMYVHLLVTSLRGDKYKKKSAYEDLWKAQNWLGFLGDAKDLEGVSRHRQQSFAALLNAEVLLRDRARFQASLTAQDFDLDGAKEFLFQGPLFNWYVDSIGGQLFEWDFLDKPWNYIDASASGLAGPRRRGFVDRFFRSDRPDTDAARLFEREYQLEHWDRDRKSFQLMVVDSLDGTQGRQPLRFKKSFSFEENSIVIHFELELLTGPLWEGWFSSEVSLVFIDHNQVSGVSVGTESESTGFVLRDGSRKSVQNWGWTPSAKVAFIDGTIAPRWWMVLHPGETWKGQLTLGLSPKE